MNVYAIDVMGVLYRAHHGMSDAPALDSDSNNVSAIFGFAAILKRLLMHYAPDAWCACWEGEPPLRRNAIFPAYKANRKPRPDELVAQIPRVRDLCKAIGLPCVSGSGLEADDALASVALVHSGEADNDVTIVSLDKDMMQLVCDRRPGKPFGSIQVLVPAGRDAWRLMNEAAVADKYGVEPHLFADWLALMGDSVDNVPGVPGIGEKTAAKLLRSHFTLDGVLKHGGAPGSKLRDNLEVHAENARLSRRLVDLDVCPLIVPELEPITCTVGALHFAAHRFGVPNALMESVS